MPSEPPSLLPVRVAVRCRPQTPADGELCVTVRREDSTVVVHSGEETAQVTAREDMRVHVRGDDGVVSRCAATLANCHVPFVLGSTSFTRRELAAELHGCVLQLLVAVVQGANEGALVRRFVAHLNLATLRDGLRAQFSAAHTQYVAGLSC